VRIETITTILDLAGVFANAVLGGAAARSRRLDLFGYAVLGLVSGLGGGGDQGHPAPARPARRPCQF
jgi:uncharacterized membrane protein YeiH